MRPFDVDCPFFNPMMMTLRTGAFGESVGFYGAGNFSISDLRIGSKMTQIVKNPLK